MRVRDLVREHLRNLSRTTHGGTAWKLGAIEDYSHNLNPFGPPPCLPDIIEEAVKDIGHYPDDSCAALKETIAEHHGLESNEVIIGTGSSEIIRNFPHVFLSPGDRALIPRPTFAEYAQQCNVAGARVMDLLLLDTEDFRIDTERLLHRITPTTKAVYICNPNNPTGRVEPRKKILEIVEECRRKDVMVFLDETLLGLVAGHEEISCASFAPSYDNLLVAESLTKTFAIPGIRIGYGISNSEVISHMDKVRMTWNVGVIEQDVAASLIREHQDHVIKASRILAEESRWVFERLKEIGFPIEQPSDSYFYFASLQTLRSNGADFQSRMESKGFMVRDCSSFGRPFEKYIRFCVKDRERDEAFVKAMSEVIESLGW
ncbi:MAG: threonine-phosphate decarboxylase [Candidatus Methanomethylophilaceae archaeon]|nr:threonine-phosphate decarboxylase [Candidatus Methanomethylophilaceae archaeon]MDI3542127.1 threonine-phosphate decarboxylase [Candidatus Methanomethylophilaceae archaeon]HIJ00218.1 histidinol-phosphate aminotransferase family protein [Candidatus Methanomethylophilaceae archaeon]